MICQLIFKDIYFLYFVILTLCQHTRIISTRDYFLLSVHNICSSMQNRLSVLRSSLHGQTIIPKENENIPYLRFENINPITVGSTLPPHPCRGGGVLSPPLKTADGAEIFHVCKVTSEDFYFYRDVTVFADVSIFLIGSRDQKST